MARVTDAVTPTLEWLQGSLQAALSREARAKSLTLRLSEPQYERLRRFAFERRLSHQDVIERGLMEYLDRQGS